MANRLGLARNVQHGQKVQKAERLCDIRRGTMLAGTPCNHDVGELSQKVGRRLWGREERESWERALRKHVGHDSGREDTEFLWTKAFHSHHFNEKADNGALDGTSFDRLHGVDSLNLGQVDQSR